jgi:hypothetical protein
MFFNFEMNAGSLSSPPSGLFKSIEYITQAFTASAPDVIDYSLASSVDLTRAVIFPIGHTTTNTTTRAGSTLQFVPEFVDGDTIRISRSSAERYVSVAGYAVVEFSDAYVDYVQQLRGSQANTVGSSNIVLTRTFPLGECGIISSGGTKLSAVPDPASIPQFEHTSPTNVTVTTGATSAVRDHCGFIIRFRPENLVGVQTVRPNVSSTSTAFSADLTTPVDLSKSLILLAGSNFYAGGPNLQLPDNCSVYMSDSDTVNVEGFNTSNGAKSARVYVVEFLPHVPFTAVEIPPAVAPSGASNDQVSNLVPVAARGLVLHHGLSSTSTADIADHALRRVGYSGDFTYRMTAQVSGTATGTTIRWRGYIS